MKHVLLIDDDKLFHESFRATIASDKIACFFASNSKQAFQIIQSELIHLIFLDLDLGDEYGLDIIKNISNFRIPICILSGTASIHTTVKALKLGAIDIVEKPISKSDIHHIIQKYSRLVQQEVTEKSWLSKSMQEIETTVHTIATTNAKILLRGKTGTGKEILARRIHQLSNRSSKPFVAVNCAAIPENLIENELFGSVKGAFTGSDKTHIGLIQMAEAGTLFLDEIADMPIHLQVKLLRFLQEGEIHPIGSNKPKNVDVRIIAATHHNLEKMLEDRTFREDLYFRLNVFTIDLPSLRDRIDDLEILISELVNKFKLNYRNELVFTKEAIFSLKQHEWKGNIRELSNLIERLMLSVFHPVNASDLPKNFRYSKEDKSLEINSTISLRLARENFERQYINNIMRHCNSLKEVSERLKIERTTLYKKLRYLGIDNL